MSKDNFYRFLFEGAALRGELVTLDDAWSSILSRHEYPSEVRTQLGQAMAASLLLSATIKTDGNLVLQTRTDGALHTIVAEASHQRTVRGIARWNPDMALSDTPAVLGAGYLAMTITPGKGERYQGIVKLDNESLASAIRHYFDQSEQLMTHLWLAADEHRAAGLMLQVLPSEVALPDARERIDMLASTVTEEELLKLDPMTLITRLFHEEDVRLFEPETVRFQCSCSRTRVQDTLRTLGQEELEDLLRERGEIVVDCEFCNASYRFDPVDVGALFTPGPHLAQGDTRH